MLGENIKELRKQKGYSQEVLAQQLNVVRQTVSKWEKGYSVPDAVMLEKISELFEVSVGDLLGETDKVTEDKNDIQQIASQLSVLNDIIAKELAIKRRKKKITLIVLSVLFLIFVSICITLLIPRPMMDYGNVNNVKTQEVESELFTQAEINSAIEAVKDYFHKEFDGCILTDIYYAGDDFSKAEEENNKKKTLVLLSSFEVGPYDTDGGFFANSTYDLWQWILTKNDDGKWQLVNYGY